MSSDSDSDGDIVMRQANQTLSNTNTNISITGKIYSVTAENFITFTHSTLYPGEELNILIGPNGAGKSSMVAAIVLGMGGTTKVLSVAKMHLSDYVKNGKDQATITVRLYKNSKRDLYTFTRSFGRDNKSTYTIDGKKVSEKDYLREVLALGVQVANLCQFLPQDRVQDFAKQNPEELFRSTQQSVCPEEMIDQFEKLKKMREDQINGAAKRQKNEAQLVELEKRLEVLSEAVRVIEERESLNTQCDVIHKKIAWMEFEKSYVKCNEIGRDFRLADDKYKKDDKAHKALVKSAEGITVKRNLYETHFRNETQKRTKCDDELNRIIGEMNALKNAIKKAKNDLAFAKRSAADHQKEIDECRMIESAYRKEYEQMLARSDSPEASAAKLNAIDAEMSKTEIGVKKLNDMRTNLNNEIDTQERNIMVIKSKLKADENEKERRIDFLRQKYPDTYKAMEWLRENRQLFRGHIFDPILVELAIHQVEHAKYVEASVGVRDLTAFTCTNVDDMNLLLKKLRNELRLKCNVVHSSAATTVQHHPAAPIASLRHLGARSYLIDAINGPAPIISYLCQIYKIHNIIIGIDELETNISKLPQWAQLIFTSNDRITIKKSKYVQDRTTVSTRIVRNNIFNVRLPPQELDQLKRDFEELIGKKDKLRNTRSEIEKKIEASETRFRLLIQKRNELQGAKSKVQEANKKLAMQSEKLRRTIAAGIDVEAETEKCSTISRQAIKKLLKFQSNAVQVYGKLTAVSSIEEEAKHRLEKFKSSNANIDVQIMSSNEQVERSKSYVDRIGNLLKDAKEECKKKQVDAMKLTNNHKPSDGKNFPFKKQFDQLSDNIDELREELSIIETQLECQSAPQRETIREYEERSRQMKQLQKEIANSERSAASIEQDLVRLHNEWFPGVQSIVNSINENFSRFMATMNCAGEVELKRKSEHEYTSYGIEIRVRYRSNEQLKPLDRFVQSGGERAVAIAVYSLSLQHLSQVPFRCVDEINQGMDPYNERRVFNMLVKIVGREHQSQFFYVSPKLLTNLSTNNYVTCCNVYNGQIAARNEFHSEEEDDS